MRTLYTLPALLAAMTVVGCGPPTPSERDKSGPVADPTADSATRPSGPAAPDFTLTMLDGRTVRLRDFAGEPVVLHFWATWCPPCRRELPVFDRIYQTYGPRGIQFLPIAVKDERDDVAKHLNEKRFHFTSAVDPRGDSFRRYKSRYVPTTVLVDGAGNIVKKHIGAASQQQWTEMMDDLLARP